MQSCTLSFPSSGCDRCITCEILAPVFAPRGPLPVRRMSAHQVVVAAAALATLVAAAVGAALAVFAVQALPQAVRATLVRAPDTSLSAQGTFGAADAQTTKATLKSAIGRALPGVPFTFWSATWSDSLGLVPGALPARPASAGPGTTPLLEAAALDDITSHAVLVSGSWPASAGTSGGAIPAALPATSAALLRVHAGQVLRLRDGNTGARLTFLVTGLYAQRQLPPTSASYWQLDSLPASGVSSASGYITYGPMIVAPAAFSGRLTPASGTWVAQPDLATVSGSELSALSAQVASVQGALDNSNTLGGTQLTSSLPTLLASVGSNLALARSLLIIGALQLLVLAVAALLGVARLLATQREGETALLSARGASRWQLTRLTAAEVIPLVVVTALAGAAGGIGLARWLSGTVGGTGTPGVIQGAGISLASGESWAGALAAAAVIAVLAAAAMLYPVLRPPGGSAARVGRGRQAALAGASRAGADLGLIALAVLAGWQLRRYSAMTTAASAGGAPRVIDPVLALAPALALAGGTVLTLRLLPAAARAADALSARGRGLTASLAGWQFSRQPLRQGGAALLIVMAVASGTLALVQHQSWIGSTSDQAAYTAGADAQVDLAGPLGPAATSRLATAPGVSSSMAVADDTEAQPAPVLAVDSGRAVAVVKLRADQSRLPASQLFGAITPSAGAGGTALPGRPAQLRLRATLSPAPVSRASVVATVTDATGATLQLPLSGALPADGRPHALTTALSGLAYPVRVSQLALSYTMPEQPASTSVTLTVTGAGLAGWSAVAASPELDSAGVADGRFADPRETRLTALSGGAAVTFQPGYGKTATVNDKFVTTLSPATGQLTLSAGGLAPPSIPAIATRAFDAANHVRVGDTVQARLNGISFAARIVAEANTFPSVPGSGLVVNLTALQSLLVDRGGAPLTVNQWWLATAGGQVPPAVTAALPPGASLISSAALATAAAANPLSAAPQQALLALAAAAALLAVTGFCVGIAASVRQRRAENALLAALGVPQRSAAVQLLLEKLLLSVPAAALGLVLGSVVAVLLVPAVTLTATGQPPVPPAVTLLDLPQTVALAAVVAILPALAAALVVFRRPDPAAELRAAEAP